MIPLSFASAVDVIEQARHLLTAVRYDRRVPVGYLLAWFAQLGTALLHEAHWHGNESALHFEPWRFVHDPPLSGFVLQLTNSHDLAQKFEERMRPHAKNPDLFPVQISERPGGGVSVIPQSSPGDLWAWAEGPPADRHRLSWTKEYLLDSITNPEYSTLPGMEWVADFFEYLFNDSHGEIPRLLRQQRYDELLHIGHALIQLQHYGAHELPLSPPSHEQLGQLEEFRQTEPPPLFVPSPKEL